MEDLHAPRRRGKRPATSAVAPANDGPALDAATEAAIEAAIAASVPLLRAHLRRELAASLPYLRPKVKRERIALRPGDEDAPVDDLTRARARALLARHTTPRKRR